METLAPFPKRLKLRTLRRHSGYPERSVSLVLGLRSAVLWFKRCSSRCTQESLVSRLEVHSVKTPFSFQNRTARQRNKEETENWCLMIFFESLLMTYFVQRSRSLRDTPTVFMLLFLPVFVWVVVADASSSSCPPTAFDPMSRTGTMGDCSWRLWPIKFATVVVQIHCCYRQLADKEPFHFYHTICAYTHPLCKCGLVAQKSRQLHCSRNFSVHSALTT